MTAQSFRELVTADLTDTIEDSALRSRVVDWIVERFGDASRPAQDGSYA